MTPKQIKIIERVANNIARNYTFPGYDREDIVQESYIIMMEAMPIFDKRRSSFETFCYTHLNHRLYNFRRDKYQRKNYKCIHCGCKHNEDCSHCRRRQNYQEDKKNIISPTNICSLTQNMEPYYEDMSIEDQEIIDIVDNAMTGEIREDYLKMKAGVYVPSVRKKMIERMVEEILDGIS